MGMFGGMKDAKRGYASNRLNEGEYVVRIDRCDHIEADRAGEGYKVTVSILAVVAGQSHNEGEVCTAIFWKRPGKTGESQWLSNIKSFIAPVMGVSDELIGESETLRTLAEVYDEAKKENVAGENALGGTVCRVRVNTRLSKSTKKDDGTPQDYCLYTWACAMEPAEIASTLGGDRVARFFPNGI